MKYLLLALTVCLIAFSALASDETKQEASKHYELAVKAFDNEDISESFIHLKNTLQVNPRHLPAKLLLAKVFFNDGNMFAAEKEFEECLELGLDINLVLPMYGSTLIIERKPDKLLSLRRYDHEFTSETEFEWLLLKGQAFLQKNSGKQAQDAFEQAITLKPNDTRAMNTLASHYFGLGMKDKASSIIERSITINNKNERTWQLQGEMAAHDGDLDSALLFFTKAFEIDSTDPKILRSLAKTYLQKRNLVKAKKFLELILKQSPNDPNASLLNAVVLMSQGNEALGLQSLADLSERLTTIDDSKLDDNNATLFIKAATEYIQGNKEKARTLLGNYLSKSPGDIAAIRMLVELHLKNNDKKQVIQLLQEQQKYTSNDFGLTLQLAHLYIGEGKLFTAKEQLKRLRILSPNHPYIVMLEAEILSAEKQPEKALELLTSYSFIDEEPLDYALKRGTLEISNGKLKQALETSRKLLKAHQNNPSVLNFAAAAHLKTKQLANAKDYINKALALEPENLTARYNQALTYKIEGQLETAASSAKAILENHPEHIPSILLIARTRMEEQRFEEALDWVTKVNAYDKSNISAHELQLAIYAQTKDWGKAIQYSRKLHKIRPATPKYLAQQAHLLMQIDRFEEAQRPLYLLFSLWDNNPVRLRDLAKLQIASKNLKGARQSLEAALKLDSSSFDIQLDLARLTLSDSSKEKTQQVIEQLQKSFGLHTQIEMLKGDLASQNKDLENARAHYTKAFELDKNNGQALINLYQLTLSGEGESEFIQLIEKHRENNPTPPWVTRLLADSYLNQGKIELAQARYEALITEPALANDTQILNNLANIYAKQNLDKALTIAKQGLTHNKNYPALLDTIGWIYLEKGMHEEALSYLREAFTLDSSNPEIRYHQGIALAHLNRKSEALKEFNAAVQLSQNFMGYEDSKRWIDKLRKILN